MNSCLYRGTVRHRRSAPREHAFQTSLFALCLDLAELPHVFDGRLLWSVERRNVASFRRADHLGDPSVPLDTAVRDLVAARTGTRPVGPIRLLTHLRYLGWCFNPVSFLYCFDAAGERVETIVADVSNTPWRERHAYVLHPGLDTADTPGRHRYEFDKVFHVSPFQDMDTRYVWRFTDPGATLSVHMECRRGTDAFFDATLTLARHELTGGELARALLRHPFMTGTVTFAIHWNALRLWLKRVPVYDHPRKRAAAGAR
mgnify:CR=1 FL=1